MGPSSDEFWDENFLIKAYEASIKVSNAGDMPPPPTPSSVQLPQQHPADRLASGMGSHVSIDNLHPIHRWTGNNHAHNQYSQQLRYNRPTAVENKAISEKPHQQWTVGSRCQAVRRSSGGHIFDAQILAMEPSQGLCTLRYLDNGQEEDRVQMDQLIPPGTIPMGDQERMPTLLVSEAISTRNRNMSAYQQLHQQQMANRFLRDVRKLETSTDFLGHHFPPSHPAPQCNHANTTTYQAQRGGGICGCTGANGVGSIETGRQASGLIGGKPSAPFCHTSLRGNSNSASGAGLPTNGKTIAPPPPSSGLIPPPGLLSVGFPAGSSGNDSNSSSSSEALKSMLMSWYLCGYHTGYFEGYKTAGNPKK